MELIIYDAFRVIFCTIALYGIIENVKKIKNSNEKKVSKHELKQARYRGNSVFGYFTAYCSLHGSCDTCNFWVRFLCGAKNGIEDLQIKIINYICKGD